MQGSIHEYFKVGIVSAMAFPFYNSKTAPGVAECVKKIATDDFFDVIELNPIEDKSKWAAVKAITQQSGLIPTYGAHGKLMASGLNPNHLEEDKRKQAETALFQGVDEAVALGAMRVTFLSGEWAHDSKEKALEQLIKTTVNVCRYAKKWDILVQLEVFDFDIAKKSLVGPAALALKYAERVRQYVDNFGLMVDLSHIPMCRESIAYTVKTLKPYITHFHFGNTVICHPEAEAYGDEHPRFGFPNSENDVKELLEFFRILKAEGFLNQENPYILSMEVKPREYEDSDIVVASTKRVINRAWAML